MTPGCASSVSSPSADHYLRCPDCRAQVNRNSARYFKEVTQPMERAASRRSRPQTNFNHA